MPLTGRMNYVREGNITDEKTLIKITECDNILHDIYSSEMKLSIDRLVTISTKAIIL